MHARFQQNPQYSANSVFQKALGHHLCQMRAKTFLPIWKWDLMERLASKININEVLLSFTETSQIFRVPGLKPFNICWLIKLSCMNKLVDQSGPRYSTLWGRCNIVDGNFQLPIFCHIALAFAWDCRWLTQCHLLLRFHYPSKRLNRQCLSVIQTWNAASKTIVDIR